MYKSPIEIVQTGMQVQLENGVMKAVQDVGVNVDKAELLKALAYDREQYQKGYADGREAGCEWISVEDRLPTESDGTILVCFPDVQPYNLDEPFVNAKHDRRVRTATYSQYSKQWYIGDMCAVGEVSPTHWMPLPEPLKEDNGNGVE